MHAGLAEVKLQLRWPFWLKFLIGVGRYGLHAGLGNPVSSTGTHEATPLHDAENRETKGKNESLVL